MDEHEFRRMLDLFPVVRSRDYCADSGSSSKGNIQQARTQEMARSNGHETSSTEDPFLQRLRMAAEEKVGAAKAAQFCEAFQEVHERLVHKELSLDSARRFAAAMGN